MSSVTDLRFGPIALRVEGPAVHPLLEAWRSPVADECRRVLVTVADELPPGTAATTAEVGFALADHADHDHLTLRGDPSRPTPWLAAFCELVARDTPLHRCLLLHAGAVTVEGASRCWSRLPASARPPRCAPPGRGPSRPTRCSSTCLKRLRWCSRCPSPATPRRSWSAFGRCPSRRSPSCIAPPIRRLNGSRVRWQPFA
nr:hypothetical protein [Deltaproteobacteria bacterium]